MALTLNQRDTRPGGSDHGSAAGYSPEESEAMLRAIAGVAAEVGELRTELRGVGEAVEALKGSHDGLSDEFRELLLAEVKKGRSQGTTRGAVVGSTLSAVVLAILPLLERLF